MLSISNASKIPTAALAPNQSNTKTDLINPTSVLNQVAEIRNTSVTNGLAKRRPKLTLNLSSLPQTQPSQELSGFQKLEKETDKHSDNYTGIASSRYPDIKTAVKTQVSIKDETTGELIPLPANYLQVADKNIAIRTQYPKNNTLSIEQHLKMLMAEKPSVLVVIASKNDIDGESIKPNKEMHLPPYYAEHAKYGSVEVKSEANGTVKYASQVSADLYQLTLTKDGQDGQKVALPVIHVTDWGDRRTISAEALRALAVDINQYAKGEGDLPVIHCMSGSGRAGTVVAAMQLVQPDNQYSTHKVVKSLRETGTPHMVQTEEQYQTLTELEPKIV